MRRLRIGIDLDGCVYPWTVAANEAVMAQFGCDDPGDHTTWLHLRNFLDGDERWRWIWTQAAADDVFGRLDLIWGDSANVINALAEEHDVHFVTHRNPQLLTEITGRWLREHFTGYRGVHLLDNTMEKHDLCDWWDVFIDDKVETIERFAHNTLVLPLMPVRDWNQEFSNPRVQRFYDWREIPGILEVLF